jgi:hypothetical protein
MEADRVAWRQWLYLIIQNRGSDNAKSKLVRKVDADIRKSFRSAIYRRGPVDSCTIGEDMTGPPR